MNKKMIIGVVFIIIVGLVITITSISLVTKSLVRNDLDNSATIAKETGPNEDILNEGEEIEEDITDFNKDTSTINYPVNENARELTKSTAKTLEEQVRKLYREFKPEEASKFLTDIVKDYKVEDSEHFSKLELLYKESSLFLYLPFVEGDNAQVLSIVNNITDPENHMLATLFIDSSLRDNLIHTEDSINPIFYGGVNVKNQKLLNKDNEHYKEALRGNKQIKSMYEFEITAENFPFKAYIVESDNDTYFFKIIEEEENSTPFYTIEEWRGLDKQYNPKVNYKEDKEEEIDIEEIKETLESENNE